MRPLLRHRREVALEILSLGQRAAVIGEGRQEDGLELAGDRSGESDVDVVELAVEEVILEPGPADVGDRAIDEDQLAMLDPARLPEARHEPSGANGSLAIRRHQVVEHHLDARGGEGVEHLARPGVRVAAERVHDECAP